MIMKLKKSDFLMAKRLKQRLARENKDRAGCMSGIVHIFDFRHGRATRRLLSDHRTYMTESTTGPSCPSSEVNSITDSEEIHQRDESPYNEKGEMAQTRVKELMEEEMQCDLTEKTSSKSLTEISIDQQVLSQKPSEYCDLEDLVNNLLLSHHRKTQEQIPKFLERSNSLDNEQRIPSSEETVSHKNRKFFRRRSKSHECISLNDNDTPAPTKTPNRFHHERSVSHFSFTEIKKKLKNVIRRCPRDSGCNEKPVCDGNIRWNSPNRDRFYSERFSRISNGFKRQDEASWLCKSERKLCKIDAFGDTSERISNIYIEAKKHLSEMLNNDDVETELTAESTSRSLGKLLSFPGYNSRSSSIGPRNKPEDGAVTMSPNVNSPVVKESQPPLTDDDCRELEVCEEIHQAEDVEVIEPLSVEEVEVFDVVDKSEEDELSRSPPASPSGSSLAFNRKAEEAESTLDDRTGKPSPVSVLEPLFSDDDISPARTILRSAESSIQPIRIRFEEMVTPARNKETCNHLVENEESAFEYVEAVLLASDLNWDEFEKRWLSSVQIIESSLYDELQIFSNRPDHDQQLLFDATNEIISEICDSCLGFFPQLSYLKTSIHMPPKGMDLINEVWERIESRLHRNYSRSLDQLIKKDLDVPRSWMDLCPETQDIVMETEESIFEDVIDDTVLSLMYDN
uniref:protein TRM32-like n=1 Tax=Erigeron canadensis TaxID=72917 RepID=UPI001CB904C9|nr:protein TRM32-like [Erigeron canadensis]